MAIAAYQIVIVNWGAAQLGTDPEYELLNAETLAATGSGTWDDVDTHQTIRLGAFAFEAGVEHTFIVRARVPVFAAANDVQFRLRDLTNGNTLATVLYTGVTTTPVTELRETTTFADLPAGDALIGLEYQLVAPSELEFVAATWHARRAA